MDDKALIKRMVSSDTTLTQEDIDVIKYVSQRYGFPPSGIDLIPTKTGSKVYINQIGLSWLVQNDDRHIREISTECLVDAYDNEKGRAKYRALIRFANTSFFIADGSASPSSVKGGKCTRDDVNAMAQTRALRKAMLLATGSSLINHEKDVVQDWEIENMARAGDNRPSFDDNEIVNMDEVVDRPHSVISLVKGVSNRTGKAWSRAVAIGLKEGQTVEYFLPNKLTKAFTWWFKQNPNTPWDVVVTRSEGGNGYFQYDVADAPETYETPEYEDAELVNASEADDIPF